MNEPRNNSLTSTIVFYCLAILLMLVIVLESEQPVPQMTGDTTESTTQTL